MRYIYLELPSFNKEERECESDFERWIYILKNMETLKRMPFKAQKSVFDKLEKIVDIASLSKEEREKYDESIKIYRDNLAVAAGQIEIGMKKGLEKGREEGLNEGIEKVARNLKLAGMSSEEISKITGLSVSEIEGF